ncbi:MAG TPA: ACP S-malonyltransferase [Thermoanaerobaculia bacterium]|jgi:[acyl-carrier-protein] S-malonyltransferase|nr:ACP S-malonyltransferase [Thermoanaerobaculia bacterium]
MNEPGFLFSGQLAEAVGMGRDFWEADPEARELFSRTSERCDRDLEKLLFEGPSDALHENLAAQAGVYLVSTLAARALERQGIRPGATAGYSLGNYAAMVAARAISYDDALEVLIAVWRETERLGIRGSMGAVVGARRDVVEETCAHLRDRDRPVWIGNVNASTQFVLTGRSEAVDEALSILAPRSLTVLRLPMSWPIHSPLMEPVARAVAPVVDAARSIRDPAIPFYGPDGRRARTAEHVRGLLGTEFVHPTLWNETYEAMVGDGIHSFVEVGPGDMLSKMARWIDRTTTCRPVGSLAAIRAVSDTLGRA